MEKFGRYLEKDIFKITLHNQFLSVVLTNFGATILELVVKNPKMIDIDVALGFDDFFDLLNHTDYIGATIGRCCNRIKNGNFTLNNQNFQLAKNDGKNHLHGGNVGYDKRVFDIVEVKKTSAKFHLFSPNGEENYPADLDFFVNFELIENQLCISYTAISNADTIFSPTNHCYFNLNGHDDGSILDNILTINATHFTPIDENFIPTGEILSVTKTPFDFTSPKPIGGDIFVPNHQLQVAGGFDHNFCLNNENSPANQKNPHHAATAYSPKTSIKMSVFTDQIGVQFYSGNFLKNTRGKAVYKKHSGFCLETQNFPNAANQKNFPSPILKAKENFFSLTKYVFDVNS